MVTTAVPALPDSHALPQAAAEIASSSARPSTSFKSVYQSLPLPPGDSISPLETSKVVASKKNLSKDTNDTLPAPVSFTAATSPSERPWTPALPSFSPAQAPTTEQEPTTREVAQFSTSEQEASMPESRQPANSSRASQTSTSQQPSVDSALFTKGLAAALAPENGNLAFSLKMMESTLQARHAQQVAQPGPTDRNQAATQTKSAEHGPAALLAPNAAHATSSPTSPAAITGDVVASAATASPVWNEAAAAPQSDVRPDAQLSEPDQPANLSTVAALHDAQPILPEAPRPSATSEILLQLGGKDQAAAIRVTDRAGAVNVSVHATDPDLRSSLRSNLGDLATQLSHQGWKTEVVKTGTTLTRGETPQDPQQGGQRSPGQQQPSSQGERQPQRDRRASSGQWLATFEEQASGNSGNPGGTNS